MHVPIIRQCIYLFILVFAGSTHALYADDVEANENSKSDIAGYPYGEALKLGKRIYRDGILPDGSTMKALVQGDIPADGQLFACVRCHRRSGLGTSEGYVVNLPVNSLNLFRSRMPWDTRRRHSRPESTNTLPRTMPSYLLDNPLRQAYTDQSLAIAIRSGVDPSGKSLNSLMPKYDLDDTAMALLITYLKQLTNSYSQGVSDTTIRFATIVTEDVKPADRQAMLSVLQAHINDRNSQVRNQLKRANNGAFNRRERDAAYRLVELSVWELKGSGESWYTQLEDYLNNDPVFAILGGISNESWEPIHAFSENHGLPVIFPVTNKPVISSEDWHTIYFSKGYFQEGEATARYLRRTRNTFDKTRIIQIFNAGSEGELMAKGFIDTWNTFDTRATKGSELITIKSNQLAILENVLNDQDATIILLWENIDELILSTLTEKIKRAGVEAIFMSQRLLQENYSLIPDELRDILFITYPYSLPGEKKRHISTLKTWLEIKGIPMINLKIQSEMYFLGWILSDALTGLRSEYYRDYFLEKIEMMKDQTHTISAYPRLSLGPDQRYASKGCYIVQLDKGEHPALMAKGDWVIH